MSSYYTATQRVADVILTDRNSFSAGALGLPRLLNDEDVATEYPSDIDDEYITAKGFQSVLPGDFTKISSALALFRCSRVLGNVLDSIYHTTLTGEQTYRKLKELEEELDTWHSNLAPHLRLQFVNGAPSTNVVHSRSPLLVNIFLFLISRLSANKRLRRSWHTTLLVSSFIVQSWVPAFHLPGLRPLSLPW